MPSAAAGRVQRRAPGLFDMTGARLSPRRGGAEEKPELRRSDEGWSGGEDGAAKVRYLAAWGGSRGESRVATVRCRVGVGREWSESGGGATAVAEWRRRGVGCLMARVARAVHAGSMSDTEVWQTSVSDKPRVERHIGRVNVDDSVAVVPHTPHCIRSRVGSRGPTLVVTKFNTPLRIVGESLENALM
jgi:hypothetical protein